MAVVRKTSETRSRALAKKTIRYIMHRREYGEKISRPLFGREEGDTQKLLAYEAIDQAPPGSRFLRVTISPDPKREDTNRDLNLRELTREAMQALAGKFKGEDALFFAAIHEGHTDNRHVNLLVILPRGRLTKHHWKAMRLAATENAREQRGKRSGRTVRHFQPWPPVPGSRRGVGFVKPEGGKRVGARDRRITAVAVAPLRSSATASAHRSD